MAFNKGIAGAAKTAEKLSFGPAARLGSFNLAHRLRIRKPNHGAGPNVALWPRK